MITVSSVDPPCARGLAHGRLYGSPYEDRWICLLRNSRCVARQLWEYSRICVPRLLMANLGPNDQSFVFLLAYWYDLRQPRSGHAEGGASINSFTLAYSS